MSAAFFSAKAIMMMQRLVRDIYRTTGKKIELHEEEFVYTLAQFLGESNNDAWKASFMSVLNHSDLERQVMNDVQKLMNINGEDKFTEPTGDGNAEKKTIMYRGQKVTVDVKQAGIDNSTQEQAPAQSKLTYRGQAVRNEK